MTHSYLTAWSFHADASQLSVRQVVPATTYQLSSRAANPQLVLNTLIVSTHSCLIHGLHIRNSTPHGQNTVSVPARQRLVSEALLLS